MRFTSPRSALLAFTLACGLLHGQTLTVSSIASSYAVTLPTGFMGQVFSDLQLGVYYPVGLPPSSYITGTQLNSDFQGFISAYPSPTDAPEAYLSIALQGILNKHPGITGGTLTGTISGPPEVIGGVTIPGTGTPIGTITIAIGTFNTGTVVSGGSGQNPAVSSITSSYTVTFPTGFTGQVFSTVQLVVTYPTGLTPSSYITINQLNSDFQGFISAYPNPADPPEAYMSNALQGILNKYSGIAGGALAGTISGPPLVIGGVTIPGTGTTIGSITAVIGNLSSAYAGVYALYGVLYGQTGTVSIVASSWAVTLPAGFNGQMFSTLDLGVIYPTGLTASSYITSKQLNSDFQGFISANSSPTDAPESYLSNSLQQILNKYSQMTGGTVNGEISGPGTTIGGITIPGAPAGSITVQIGTYSPYVGLTGFSLKQSIAIPRKVPALPAAH